MDVVCFNTVNDFTELWRVVFEGRSRRVKVMPSGETTRYDGKGNMPKPELNQVMRLWPSKDEKKLDAVREAFSIYAAQEISFTKLSGILNDAGFRAGGGTLFTSENVILMLRNPIYTGRPAWNKRHAGKFQRWSDGRAIEVDHNGKRCFENPENDGL